MRSVDHAHLLTPTIMEWDDSDGFNRPLNPHGLIIVAAMAGLIPAGFALAENAHRLRIERWVFPTLLGALIGAVVAFSGMNHLVISLAQAKSPALEPVLTMLPVLRLSLRVGAAYLLAWPQFHRYRVAVNSGSMTGSWRLVIVASVLYALLAWMMAPAIHEQMLKDAGLLAPA